VPARRPRRGWRAWSLLAVLALAAACGRHDFPLDPDAEPLLPAPVRAVAIAGVVAGSVAQLWCDAGAPPTQPIAAPDAEGTLTWLGHAGVLLALGGQVVIVDPILAEAGLTRASLGGRLAEAPDLSGLRRLDAVLITHDDQDHFDLPTLRALAARFPQARLIVPHGLEPARHDTGFARVTEVAPGQTLTLGRLRVTPAPVVHLGRRNPLRITPATGWALRAPQGSVFLTGDSAYGPVFARTGAALGPFDLAVVPIGAWRPARVFGNFHATPEQAIRMAADLGAPRAVPHHWGTFRLSPDSPAESLARFRAAARAQGIDPVTLPVGGQTCIRPR